MTFSAVGGRRPGFCIARWRCDSTVRTLSTRRSAISAFDRPWPARSTSRRSRIVSAPVAVGQERIDEHGEEVRQHGGAAGVVGAEPAEDRVVVERCGEGGRETRRPVPPRGSNVMRGARGRAVVVDQGHATLLAIGVSLGRAGPGPPGVRTGEPMAAAYEGPWRRTSVAVRRAWCQHHGRVRIRAPGKALVRRS
jgi:hypothetical protein